MNALEPTLVPHYAERSTDLFPILGEETSFTCLRPLLSV